MKTYKYKVQGVDYEVEIAEVEGKIAKVNVNGIPFEIEMQKPINAAKHPALAAAKQTHPRPLPASEGSVNTQGVDSAAKTSTPLPRREGQGGGSPAAGAGTAIKAPLPGTINAINVKVGDKVGIGDVIIVLEAMKMQNNIEAETAGTVTSVLVNQGDTVMEGAVMLTIG
jgi:biotin carboxyl carrier protein